MVKKISLNVQTRTEKNGKAKKLRALGFAPAVIYSSKDKTRILKVKINDFLPVYSIVGEANILDLIIDEKESIKVIIKDVQKEVVKDNIIHIDFYQVDMKKKIEVNIPLNFIGESKAVKELNGILMKNLDEINARCLPGDLLDKLDVDISTLNTFSDSIKVKDLKVSSNIEIVNNETDMIVHVIERKEVEEEVTKEEKEGEEEPIEDQTDGEGADVKKQEENKK